MNKLKNVQVAKPFVVRAGGKQGYVLASKLFLLLLVDALSVTGGMFPVDLQMVIYKNRSFFSIEWNQLGNRDRSSTRERTAAWL